jgi:hypothetical protein
MFATVKMGDFTLTIEESGSAVDPNAHTIVAHEEYSGIDTKTVIVATEAEACELLRDYLNPEEPGETFQELFAEFC